MRFHPVSLVIVGVFVVLAKAQNASSVVDELRRMTCSGDGRLPKIADCIELLEAVHLISQEAGGDLIRAWGPTVPETASSWPTPKFFYLRHHPITILESSTCMFRFDYLPREGYPDIDTFSYADAAAVADRLITTCLFALHKIGYDFPGPRRTIYESLRRYNAGIPVGGTADSQPKCDQSWDVTVKGRSATLCLSSSATVLQGQDNATSIEPQQFQTS